MNQTQLFQEIHKQEILGSQYAKGIIHEHQEQPAFQAESFWQEIVLNFLKRQALNFVGKFLVEIKKQAITHLTTFAEWLIENLEDYLFTLYQNSTPEEKEIFKKNISEKFPHSRLVQKLN